MCIALIDFLKQKAILGLIELIKNGAKKNILIITSGKLKNNSNGKKKKGNIRIKRMVRIPPTRIDPGNGNKPFVARFKNASNKKSYKKITKRKRGIFNKALRKSFKTPMKRSLFNRPFM